MKHFALFVTLLACLSTGCNRQTELVSAQETTRNQSGSDNADNSDNKTKPTGLIKRHPQLDQLLDPRPHAAPLFPVARSNATANPFVQTLQLFLSHRDQRGRPRPDPLDCFRDPSNLESFVSHSASISLHHARVSEQ